MDNIKQIELWKAIQDFPNYQISDHGRVKNSFGHILKPWLNAGYPMVELFLNGSKRRYCIHRLVLEAFFGPPLGGLVCNHIDGNKTNNHISNLEWITQGQNIEHARNIGLIKMPKQEEHWQGQKKNCKNGHAFDESNTYNYNGHRICRRCAADRTLERRRKSGSVSRGRYKYVT